MIHRDRKKYNANTNVSFRLIKMKSNMEDPLSSAANVNAQTEELPESKNVVKMGSQEREGKLENGDGSKDVVNATGGGGYSRDRPPVDDCCPICFDDFYIPCRTSCGHWYCANCILLLWKYMANFKQCTCPICGSLIFNVVPHSSVLIQPDQEVSRVLKQIKKYNTQNMVGWFGIFIKALAMPLASWRRLTAILQMIRLIGLLLRVAYEAYGFQFFPHGGHGIRMLFRGCSLAVLIVVTWWRWTTIRRDTHLAQQNLLIHA